MKILLSSLLFLSLLGNITQEYFRRIHITEDLKIQVELQAKDMSEVDQLSKELELLQINRDLLMDKEFLLDSIKKLNNRDDFK